MDLIDCRFCRGHGHCAGPREPRPRVNRRLRAATPRKARPRSVHRNRFSPQTYSIEQIEAGELRFSSQCGFCHGRDAAGGETGPNLTRSKLVAADNRGDKIGKFRFVLDARTRVCQLSA